MFIKILKKDLKRKKAMNIILFLFMIIASMLLASSVNLLYSTTTALDNFMKLANTADNIIITFPDTENNKIIEEWSRKSDKVKDINFEDMLLVGAEDIKLPTGKPFEDPSTLSLARIPEKNNLLFNEKDQRLQLHSGEIAIPDFIRNNTGLQIGDRLTIKIGKVEKAFTVKNYIKDALFGSGMMGFKRLIISENDFAEYSRNTSPAQMMRMWSITKNESATYSDVEKDFNKTSIVSISTFNNSTVATKYFMDLMLAAIMSIVSLFLIFISFLILRFTIRFTIEEDFKEIGIMKAIGLRNGVIKKIYLVKYLILSLSGGVLGFGLSILCSNYLLGNISRNIIMTTSLLNYVMSALSSVVIVLLTIIFCYFCTGRINKMTAIDAIRQGSTGERFSVSKRLKLHKMKFLSSPVYMAISDIISGFRKFIILTVTFILGTIIIIVPINCINTLASDDLIELFGLGKADINLRPNNDRITNIDFGLSDMMKDINEIEKKMGERGYAVDLHPEIMFMGNYYASSPDDSKNILSLQGYNYSTDNYMYLSGTPPVLPNEIAITGKVADYFGIGVGDTIIKAGRYGTKEYIVTGLYQSLFNLGFSIRFSEKNIMDLAESAGINYFGDIQKRQNISEQMNSIIKEFPEYDIKTGREYIEGVMGNISEQINQIKNIILLVVLGINFLITFLLVRMLITKEIPEIAILKSIGFRDGDIRIWQAIRIMLILSFSIILGTLIANTTGHYITHGIFSFMGATQIQLTIIPLQVYFIYPLIILSVTMTAVLLSLGQVKRTNIWELNNQE